MTDLFKKLRLMMAVFLVLSLFISAGCTSGSAAEQDAQKQETKISTEDDTTSTDTASADTDSEDTSEATNTEEADTTEESSSDGIYTGTGYGKKGSITVEVTIDNDLITDITVISHNEDKGYYETAFSQVSAEIISSQSLDVATVSGATISSNGLIEAVEDALSQADNN
jgi:uncharacterized protein with FMN-binding domain